MNRRYQVFVSSTYEDLKEERSRVITALLNINCIPCGMEYFPAADEDAWRCIERLVPECDYYVLILAGKYGSIPKGRQKSYTHLEYELAVKHRVPVITLLHRNPKKLAAERCEDQPNRRQKLERFREQVGRKLCRYWEASDQLPGELLASLTHQIDRFPRSGWVRAGGLAGEEAKDEIIKLQKKVERQQKLIEDYSAREEKEDRELARGDEVIALSGMISGKAFQVTATWDGLFAFMHRNLSRQWDRRDLEYAVEGFLRDTYREQFKCYRDLKLDRGEIGLVITQFVALKLIISKSTYYEFSAKGIVAASQLKAIPKGQIRKEIGDWCVMKWPEFEADEVVVEDAW